MVFVNLDTMEVYSVPDGIVELGRKETMGVHIPEPSVSGTHARIYNVEEGLWVEDLGSTNGTFIHGSVVTEPTMLEEGSEVYFGTVRCKFEHRKAFQVEVTSRLTNVDKLVDQAQKKEAEKKEVPEHTVPSESAVHVYRRKTSRVSFDKFKQVINEGEDYSDSKPLPSKYEMSDSGRIAPARPKTKRKEDFQYKQPVPQKTFPWKEVLIATVVASLVTGVVVGFVVASIVK